MPSSHSTSSSTSSPKSQQSSTTSTDMTSPIHRNVMGNAKIPRSVHKARVSSQDMAKLANAFLSVGGDFPQDGICKDFEAPPKYEPGGYKHDTKPTLPEYKHDPTEARVATVPISLGKPVLVRYKCHDFELKQDLALSTYRIAFTPSSYKSRGKKCTIGKRLRREIVRQALSGLNEVKVAPDRRPSSEPVLTAFDGSETLVSTQRIPCQLTKERPVSDFHSIKLPEGLENLKVSITPSALLQRKQLDSSNASHFAKALSILLQHREYCGSPGVPLGKERLFPLNEEPTRAGHLYGDVEYLTRYYVDVKVVSSKVHVTVNFCVAACQKEGFLLDSMEHYGTRFVPELEATLKNLRVKVDHLKDPEDGSTKVRYHTVTGLAEAPFKGAGADVVSFPWKQNGRDDSNEEPTFITVQEYFRRVHAIGLSDATLPVVNIGTADRPVFLPPDLCKVIPGQLYRRQLHPVQFDFLMRFASSCALDTSKGERGMIRGLEQIGKLGQQKPASPLPSNVARQAASAEVEILAVPKIVYSKNAMVKIGDGVHDPKEDVRKYRGWNLKNQAFVNVKAPRAWSILYLYNGPGAPPLEDEQKFTQQLEKYFPHETYFNTAQNFVAPHAGSKFRAMSETQRPGFKLELPSRSSERKQKELTEALSQVIGEISKNKIGFLLVVLPKKSDFLHRLVKHYLEHDNSIRSVFLVGPEVDKVLKGVSEHEKGKKLGPCQYFANVAMKMNIKHGGTNQQMDAAAISGFADQPKSFTGSTMFVGLDVTPRAVEIDGEKHTVVSAVAATDSYFSQWPARFRVQVSKSQQDPSEFGNERSKIDPKTGKKVAIKKTASATPDPETISDLDSLFGSLLDNYRTQNERLPSKIVIYRNGVSSTQHKFVFAAEKAALDRAFKNKYNKTPPKLVFIMVGKGHKTRFNMSDSDGVRPSDGAVLDVMSAEYQTVGEFLLQPHSGALQKNNKGDQAYFVSCARPTRYTVIANDSGKNLDALKKLTHILSYHVGYMTRAAALCAPAHFASLASKRAIASLKLCQDMSTTMAAATWQIDVLTGKMGAMALVNGKSPASTGSTVKSSNVSPTANPVAKKGPPGAGAGPSSGRAAVPAKPAANTPKRSFEPKIVHEDLKDSMFYI